MLKSIAGPGRQAWVTFLLMAGCLRGLQAEEIHRLVMGRIQPDYPMLALRMHIEDTVIVEVTANPDGSASHPHAISGHPLLREAAERCVAKWRFMRMPKTDRGTVAVVFSLSGE